MVTNSFNILFLTLSTIFTQKSHGTAVISGVINSAYTPFHKNGSVNYGLIPVIAEQYKNSGIKHLLIVSYGGEGTSLTHLERVKIVDKWIEACSSPGCEMKILVQVGGQELVSAVKLAKYCNKLKKAGKCIAGLVVLPVITYKGNLDDVLNDLQPISDAAPDLSLIFEGLAPITTPKESTVNVILAAIEKISNFVGAAVSIETALLLRSATSLQDLTIIIYGNDRIDTTFASKFNGSLVTAANIFPEPVLKIEAAYQDGNYEEGWAQQAELNRLYSVVNRLNGNFIDYTDRSYFENEKEIFRLRWGIDLGKRIPLTGPSPDEVKLIASKLEDLGVELKASS